MKHLALLSAALVSFTLAAAPEKAVTVRITDTAGLVAAVSKMGEFIGNPMLAVPLAAGLSQNPVVEFFGPGRPGVPLAAIVYVEPEGQLEATGLPKDEDIHAAALYPLTKGKAGFAALHADAVETNGVLKLTEPQKLCVAFSADGAWASVSDDPAWAKAALAEVPAIQQPLAGDLADLRVTPAGLKFFGRIVETSLKKDFEKGNAPVKSEATLKDILTVIHGFTTLDFAVRIDNAGLTFRTSLGVSPASPLAALGKLPLAAGDALAFAGPDAVYAAAFAPNCGQKPFDPAWAKLVGFMTKHGLETTYLAVTKKDAARTLTLDFDAAVKYFQDKGAHQLDTLDPLAFANDLAALGDGESAVCLQPTPAGAVALALKGADTKATPSARFRKIAPEAASVKPFSISVTSVYALLKELAPKIVALMPEETRTSLQPLIGTLPPVGQGGSATWCWRAGDVFQGVLRVSPDEIKGISAAVTVGVTYWSMQSAQAMQMDEEDPNVELEEPAGEDAE